MKTGIKTIILEGSEVLKNNLLGQSISKEYKGVFADSLLLNQLKTMGLKISKNETTRDIIGLEFEYGYNPLLDEKVKEQIDEIEKENEDLSINIKEKKAEKKSNRKMDEVTKAWREKLNQEITSLKEQIKANKLKVKDIIQVEEDKNMNKESVRDYLYKNGFKLDFYKKVKKSDEYVIDETIEYKFWFRTPSKSRVGDVMFINAKLLDEIRDWQRMGLKLPLGEAKIVEMLAYESLTASHIENTITIDPDRILVVNDIDSFFTTKCAIVYVDEKGECKVENKLAEVKNTLFDGQALLDDSMFTGSNGMMLLRQHFFKACAFRTYIQDFMKDWCKENNKDYDTYEVTDRYGNNIKVKEVLCITTENAMKWEKFINLGASYNYWKQKVNECNNEFGICKVDHESKFGAYQRMSYQMLNTLDIDQKQMNSLAKHTIDYINELKDNNDLFCEFLKRTASDVNPNLMLVDLYNQNKDFANSKFFKEYKSKRISEYVETVRGGKLLVKGDNLTVVGNPYTMLLHAVGCVPVIDGVLDKTYVDKTLPLANEGEDQYISVYTKRFNDREYLCAFRNPHNSPNNIGYHKNFRHELMEKYFNFSNNIMAVNMIQTEEQSLKNGQDMDSDFNFVTNEIEPVKSAKKVFRKFPCIVNEIEQSSKSYENTIESYALIDNALAKAKYDIGLSSNLAQLAMSWYWADKTDELADIVATMSVLAQCAIDNAKRLYQVDVRKEISRISDLPCMNNHMSTSEKGNEIKGKPYFWKYVSSKVKEQSLVDCDCPMNYLQFTLDEIKVAEYGNSIDTVKFIEVIEGKANDKQMPKIEEAIKKYDDAVKEHNDKVAKSIISENKEKWEEKQETLNNEVVSYICGLKIQQKTMQILVAKALSKDGMNKKYKRKLLNALYQAHRDTFLSVFKTAM